MKKSLFRRKLPLLAILLVLVIIVISGTIKDTPPAPGFGTLNFDTDPPIAKSMTVRQLKEPSEGGNIVFTATFDPNAIGSVKQLTVFLNTPNSKEKTQVILHDDGQGEDVKAGDFIFSGMLKEDIAVFKASMGVAEAGLVKAAGTIVSFQGRSGAPSKRAKLFDMVGFDNFLEVAIDRSIFDLPPGGGPSPSPCTPVIDRFKSLMITDISVTEDPVRTFNPCTGVGNPNGAWTFKTLMKNMANEPGTGISVDSLTREWLDSWLLGTPRLTPGTVNPQVNTQVLDSRVHPVTPLTTQATTVLHTIIKPWLRAVSGNPATVIDSLPSSPNYWKAVWRRFVAKGADVMAFAPFKTTAIVNRVDLRGNSGYGGGLSSAGEGRIVFSIIKDPKTNCGNPVTSLTAGFAGFTVIFEFGIPIRDCAALLSFQNSWRNLSDQPFGAAFNERLEKITNVFTGAGADPSKPNGSALNQLRTNEIAHSSLISGAPFWQLREFFLPPVGIIGGSLLKNTTTKLEAMAKYNGAILPPITTGNTAADITTLANFVNANTAAIEANNYTVPEIVTGSGGGPVNFLAGRADVRSPSPTSSNHHWNGQGVSGSPTFIVSDSARFVYSLNNCSSCHAGETGTVFTHIRFVGFGHNITPTSLSGTLRDISSFLTGLGADAVSTDNDNDLNGLFFVTDAAGRPTGTPRIRGFNDLMMREQSMRNLLCNGCGQTGVIFDIADIVTFKPITKSH
jgi:hypothetical protein